MHKIFIFLLFIAVNGYIQAQTNKRFYEKADSVLKQMTLDEKIGQLNMITGNWEATGPVLSNPDKENDIKSGKVGSMLNVKGALNTYELQKLALQSRLHIPLLFGLDVIHGYKTILPIPLAQAASFDTTTIRESAAMVAKETVASGVHWNFSPMLDVARDPRWGRVMECPGEDPFLASAIAKAVVEGYQKPVNGLKLIACGKHFAAYSAAIGGRDYNTVDISDQTLHNTYLPPFKAATEAGISSFMCSFNEINGIPSSGNQKLYSILYKDWNFKGLVVSDWGSIGEMVTHGYSKDREMAAKQAIKAGVDIDMESFCYSNFLKKMVEVGSIGMDIIDNSVRKVLMQKFELGLFDNPFKYCNAENEQKNILTNENKSIARNMARKSIVLLKNNNILPLKQYKKIAIIGPLANSVRDMDGNWVLMSNKVIASTVLMAIKENFPKSIITYSKGCDINSADRNGFADAKKMARNADIVILALGESWEMSGEAKSRGELSIPGIQEELACEIYKANPSSVTLIFGGRPLIFPKIAEKAPAIVYCWWLGTESGYAIADVLWGKYNPSARLPMSFPKHLGQIPVYYNQKNSGRPATDEPGNYSGRYIDIDYKPQYPFGYGLSYTTFAYDSVQTKVLDTGISLKVKLTNTGSMAGGELVQVYTHLLWGETTSPVKELKAFEQVYLNKNESKIVTLFIPYKNLSYYGNSGWCNGSGDYEIMLGKNAMNIFYKEKITVSF